jgi:hypothetical protein
MIVQACLEAFGPNALQNTGYAAFENPFSIPALTAFDEHLATLFFLLTLALSLISAFSLVLRFRRSSGDEREQIKWFASAGAFLAVAFLIAPLIWNTPALNNTLLWPALFLTAITLVPISIGVAILKYRLYDIDIIIRRTLVYSILTGFLGLVYFGIVSLLEQLFTALTGQRQSEIVTIVSTLAIAALFNPLRRRVQALIDRRFYRRKYDAQKVLAAFGATVRDEVELDKLTSELVTVVDETMQPAGVGLWLKPLKESRSGLPAENGLRR